MPPYRICVLVLCMFSWEACAAFENRRGHVNYVTAARICRNFKGRRVQYRKAYSVPLNDISFLHQYCTYVKYLRTLSSVLS